MDQTTLYDRQVQGSDAVQVDYADALIRRDAFVIEELRRITGSGQILDVVELSIGEGRLTAALLAALPRIRLTCADIAPSRLAFVRNTIDRDPALQARMPTFIECNFDTEFAAVPTRSMDAAIALDVMEHVVDVFGFVENCRRILRPGGTLFLRVPNLAYVKHRLALLRGRLPVTASWFETPRELTAWRTRHGWDGGHLHQFTIPMLYKLLCESGFQIETCRDPGTKWSGVRDLWPSLLYSNPLILAKVTE
jgi:2-polyprenyl-3-methyl-5-hydroxy-6-metoxy-1,4-benzoquinol methylase